MVRCITVFVDCMIIVYHPVDFYYVALVWSLLISFATNFVVNFNILGDIGLKPGPATHYCEKS